ncbi:hypothetical protein ACR777_15080 [Sphingobacterium spiritivorum]|uniref:hypothetical protein n=1 Tax=Sphingobacterium spiritivorum TaxID=258 RepID=UPI003DA4B1D0
MGKHKIEFKIESKSHFYEAPADWNSMQKKDLHKWAGIVLRNQTIEDSLEIAVYSLYNLPKGLFCNIPSIYMLQLKDTLRFLATNTLTKNVIGTIRIFGKKFYGPGNKLANLTIAEYRRTEIYYQLYQKTKSPQFLLLLVSTLYRPHGNNINGDDLRCAIDEGDIHSRADFFKWALSHNLRCSILLFYEGCRSYIIENHPEVYKPISNNNHDPFNQTKNSNELIDLEDHILSYAGGKLGNYKETSESNLYLFLKHMTQKIEELERSSRNGK